MSTQIAIRIILSPFIFLWACLGLFLLTFVLLPIVPVYSIFSLISYPFIWLLMRGGSDVSHPEPVIGENEIKNPLLGHIAGATVYIWFPFFVAFDYIKNGDIFSFGL